MSFLLCFISSSAGNAVLVLQFFVPASYWFVKSQGVDIMTYDSEATVAKTQARAEGTDPKDGPKACSSGLPGGGSAR